MITATSIDYGAFRASVTTITLAVGFLGLSTSKLLLRLAIIRALLYSDDDTDGKYTPLGSLLISLTAILGVMTLIVVLPTELAAPIVLSGSGALLYRKFKSG